MRYKNIKKFRTAASFAVIFAVCCGIIASPRVNYPVRATASITDLEDKKQELEKRNEEIDGEIEKLDSDIAESEALQDLYWDKLQTQKDRVDNYNNLIYYKNTEISDKQDEIDEKDLQISAKEDEIARKEKEIETLQEENAENLEQFGEIVHAMYVTDGVDIFSILAQSSDFYDLLVRAKLMMNISEQNTRFMDDLLQSIHDAKQMKQQLEEEAERLSEQRQQLVSDKEALEKEKQDLEGLRSEAQSLSDDYNSNYSYYTQQISNYESRQEALEEEKKINAAEAAAYEEEIQKQIREAQLASTQVYEEGEWKYPLDWSYTMITTYFGWDSWRNGMHNGVDISGGGIHGANIYASKGGTVITAKTDYIPGYSYGMYVVIDHGDGYSTLYGHCSAIYVSVGQQVSQGEVIAAVGNTGWSTGAHLHFEVRIDGTAYDPFNYIPRP